MISTSGGSSRDNGPFSIREVPPRNTYIHTYNFCGNLKAGVDLPGTGSCIQPNNYLVQNDEYKYHVSLEAPLKYGIGYYNLAFISD